MAPPATTTSSKSLKKKKSHSALTDPSAKPSSIPTESEIKVSKSSTEVSPKAKGKRKNVSEKVLETTGQPVEEAKQKKVKKSRRGKEETEVAENPPAAETGEKKAKKRKVEKEVEDVKEDEGKAVTGKPSTQVEKGARKGKGKPTGEDAEVETKQAAVTPKLSKKSKDKKLEKAASKPAMISKQSKKSSKLPTPDPEPEHSDEDEDGEAQAKDADADDDVHIFGFSTDEDGDSSDEDDDDMDDEPLALDVTKLPTIAKDDAVVKRKLEKAKRRPTEDRGVIYLGRVPHGFYEDQMRSYFNQFGDVTRLRLSRNKRTGRSKHYAFIEFDSSTVAQIVAETMDNYLLMGHILTCKVIPKDEVHPELWVGANRKWRAIPTSRVARVKHNKPRTEEEQRKAESRLIKRQAEKKRKLAEAGIDYQFDAVAYKKKPKAAETS